MSAEEPPKRGVVEWELNTTADTTCPSTSASGHLAQSSRVSTASLERSRDGGGTDTPGMGFSGTPELETRALVQPGPPIQHPPWLARGEMPMLENQVVPLWNARPEAVPRSELRAQPVSRPSRISGGFGRATASLRPTALRRVNSAPPPQARALGSWPPQGRPLFKEGGLTEMKRALSYRALQPTAPPQEGFGSSQSQQLKLKYDQLLEDKEYRQEAQTVIDSQRLEAFQQRSARRITLQERYNTAVKMTEERHRFERRLAQEELMEAEMKQKEQQRLTAQEQRCIRIQHAVEERDRIRNIVQMHQLREQAIHDEVRILQQEESAAKRAAMREQGKARLERQRLREKYALQERRQRAAQLKARKGLWPVQTQVVRQRIEMCENRMAANALETARRKEQALAARQRARAIKDYVRDYLRLQEEQHLAERRDAEAKRRDQKEQADLQAELQQRRVVDGRLLRSELVHRAWEEQERGRRVGRAPDLSTS